MVSRQNRLKQVPPKEDKQHIKKPLSSLSVFDVRKSAIPKAQTEQTLPVPDPVTGSLLQFDTWKQRTALLLTVQEVNEYNLCLFHLFCKQTQTYTNICVSVREKRINLKSCDKCLYVKILQKNGIWLSCYSPL